MYYPDELVEEIRLKSDIVDIISGYVRLQKKGASHFGLCPFHNEKSPSFSVSRNKQMYYCFGCGAGGNVFTFIMQYENFSFQEAIKHLAERAGVALPEIEYTQEMKQKETRRAKLLEINKEAAKYYYYNLRQEAGKIGMNYLKGRALTDDTIKNFGLGYSMQYNNALVKYLKSKGYADELIRASGLVNHDEKYGMTDKFFNRVIFPIQDINHRVIGFGGRVMGDAKPKYLNSPETEIFDKGRNLYGLNFARTSRKNNIILCEGYMDVIAMHQAGFTQAVASLGTAFTSGQASLLKRYTEEVLLIYDSDEAGTKAAMRAIPILKEAGIRAKVVSLKPYKDPDEFIKNMGPEAFQERLDNADNSFFFEIGVMEKNYKLDDPEEKTAFYREIAKKLCDFPEDVERDNYLEAVARRYGVDRDNLRKLVISYAAKVGLVSETVKPKSGIQSKKDLEDGSKTAQKLLLTWLTEEPEIYPKISKYVSKEDFTEELYYKVAEVLFEELKDGQINPAGIISMFEDGESQREVASLFNTKLHELESRQEKERALHDILMKVKKNSYEVMQKRLGADINALKYAIEGKKALEELSRTHISFD